MTKEDLLNKLLCAELTKQEENVLIKYMEEDEDFAETVKLHSLFQAERSIKIETYLSDAKASADVKKHIDPKQYSDLAVQGEVGTSPKSQRYALFSIVRNIAAIFILGCIVYFSFTSLIKASNTSLVEEYYQEPFQGPGTLLGENEDVDAWMKAKDYYSSEKYDMAESELARIGTLTSEQTFYLSLCNMYKATPNFTKSIELFNSIIEQPDNLYNDATRWYLAISYLKSNQNEFAKPILEGIAATTDFKHVQAARLLNSWDSFD